MPKESKTEMLTGVLPPPPEQELVITQKVVLGKQDIKGDVGTVETAEIIKDVMGNVPPFYEIRGMSATIACNQPFKMFLLHVGESEEVPISQPVWAGSIIIPGLSTNPLLMDMKSSWDGENTHSVSFCADKGCRLRCKETGGEVNIVFTFYGTTASEPALTMQIQITVAKNWSPVYKNVQGQGKVSMGSDSSIYEGQMFPKDCQVTSAIQLRQGAKVKKSPQTKGSASSKFKAAKSKKKSATKKKQKGKASGKVGKKAKLSSKKKKSGKSSGKVGKKSKKEKKKKASAARSMISSAWDN